MKQAEPQNLRSNACFKALAAACGDNSGIHYRQVVGALKVLALCYTLPQPVPVCIALPQPSYS